MKMVLIGLLFFGVCGASCLSFAQDSEGKSELIKPSVPGASGPLTPAAKPDAPVATPVGQITSAATDKIIHLATATTDAQTEKILNSLAQQAGWFPHLTISVKDGMVTIKGRTKDSVHLEWLAKTADRFPNVVAVINQAQIETPPVSDFTPVIDESRALLEKAKKALPRIAAALLLLVLFYFINLRLSKLVYRLWGRSITNLFLHGTVARLTMLPIWLFFFYLTLQVAGLQSLATTIIGGTGAVGLILGFAFKDIMSNYLSGILLAIRSPFTKGDDIQIGDYKGFIQSLSMRGTTIIDADGNLILIPNATVTQSVIINKSITKKKRTSFTVTISFRDPVANAISVIENILKEFTDILADPKPLVLTDRFSDTGVDLKVLFWFDDQKSSGDKIKSAALEKIRQTLLTKGYLLPGGLQNLLLHRTTEDEVLRPPVVDRTVGDAHSAEDRSPYHKEEAKRLGQGVDIMRKSSET